MTNLIQLLTMGVYISNTVKRDTPKLFTKKFLLFERKALIYLKIYIIELTLWKIAWTSMNIWFWFVIYNKLVVWKLAFISFNRSSLLIRLFYNKSVNKNNFKSSTDVFYNKSTSFNQTLILICLPGQVSCGSRPYIKMQNILF